MNLYLQYGIVFIVVVAAGWSAWRKLRGRRVLARGAKATDAAGCASCESAKTHHR